MGCKFNIGQRIVALEDHHSGDFLKDQEFVVLDVAPVCTNWGVKIAEGNKPNYVFCQHGAPWYLRGIFYDQTFFAPVQEIGEMTFEEALVLVEPKVEKIKD
jgi:hypothetical protein